MGRRLNLQIAEKAIEGLAVAVVVLPEPEVADMACSPDVRRPTGLALHHGIVEADRSRGGG